MKKGRGRAKILIDRLIYLILKGKDPYLPIGPSNGGITFLSRSIAFRHSFWTDCICCILSGTTHFCSFIAVMVSSCRFSAVCSMTPSRYLRHSRKLASQYLSYEKFLYFIHLFFPLPPPIFAVNFGYISIDLSRIFFLNRFIRRKSKTGIESQLKYRLITDQLIFFFFQVAHRSNVYTNW